MFLSSEQLQQLTGYQRLSAQRRWLTQHGWPHEIDGRGRPVVLSSIAADRLGAQGSDSEKEFRPRWEKMRGKASQAA